MGYPIIIENDDESVIIIADPGAATVIVTEIPVPTIIADTEVISITETAPPVVIVTETPVPAIITESVAGPQGIKGVQGEEGEPGPKGDEASELKVNFAWGDATPAILAEIPEGETIYTITLVILEPFDGIGAALSIGVTGDPALFMGTGECDPMTVGVYSVSPGYKFAANVTLRLFITPGAGASKGNGIVMIDY